MKTLRVKITGLVQGVFFRKYIKEEAQKLDLKGHVRNLETGEVEVILEGKDEDVDIMVLCCKKGPANSNIKSVDLQEMNHIGFDEFKILSI